MTSDVEKMCLQCGALFFSKKWTPRKFCSKRCSSKYNGPANAKKGLETQKANGTILGVTDRSKYYA